MIILDKPYVSPFLIETIQENQLKVIDTSVARELVARNVLPWISESEAIDVIKKYPFHPLYTNSENALDWIVQHFAGSALARQIHALKDKVIFRTLLKNLFPHFYFREIGMEEIHTLDPGDLLFPFVIKPSIGFFSIGVHIVHDKNDWNRVKDILTSGKLESVFPDTVLNTHRFIIEALITGEEYAVDYYHDRDGKVVILNVMHHLFSSGSDTSDRVYTTSKDIILRHRYKIEEFLTRIGDKLELKNFPAHAEVRIGKNGEMLPIEINPMRFGGWCTTADLMGIALGYNSYVSYFQHKEPNWDKIFRGKEDHLYSIIVLDNNSGIETAEITRFDYEKLVGDFENPLAMRKFDIRTDGIFGFLFTETIKGNEKELFDVLRSDLRKYITRK